MLNLEQIQKFSKVCGIGPKLGSTNGLMWHISMMSCENDIFSKSNDFYRENKNSWKIQINPTLYDYMTHELDPNVFLCLVEINKLVNQIKQDLEMTIKHDEINITDTKLYYWSYYNKYYYSNCIFKVYFDILFKKNYIYILFGSYNEVNLWKLNSMITINELITTLMNKSNDLYVEQIDNIIVL